MPSPLAKFPRLQQFYADFRALPELAKYFAGENYRLPVNNKMACFVGAPKA